MRGRKLLSIIFFFSIISEKITCPISTLSRIKIPRKITQKFCASYKKRRLNNSRHYSQWGSKYGSFPAMLRSFEAAPRSYFVWIATSRTVRSKPNKYHFDPIFGKLDGRPHFEFFAAPDGKVLWQVTFLNKKFPNVH